jgi:F-type H+-transporting ATPase subunit b
LIVQIDWLTVSAQIVNFLVLVWLLKRFLYRPIVQAMTRRQELVAQRLAEAEERESQATLQREHYQSREAELERTRKEWLGNARDEVQVQRQTLLDGARAEVAAARQRWLGELEREREELGKALRRQVAESALAVARRTLAALADAQIEAQTVRAFLRQLEELDAESRAALASGHGAVEVRTAFEVDETLRKQLADALAQLVGERRAVHFRRDPDLVQGIAVTAGGRRLSWSVTAFVDEVRSDLDGVLQEAAQAIAPGQG